MSMCLHCTLVDISKNPLFTLYHFYLFLDLDIFTGSKESRVPKQKGEKVPVQHPRLSPAFCKLRVLSPPSQS